MISRFASVLALGLLLGACQPQGPEFRIVSGSENRVLEPIVMAFCAERNATCTMDYLGSLDIGLSLRPGRDPDADAVWPADGIWIDMFDTGRRVRSLKSIAQTPVILGVRETKARDLGWIDRPVAMADILSAVRSGDLSFLMTSATQSNSGASAYLAMISAAVGKDVIEMADLEDEGARDMVSTLLAGVARSSGSSGWLAELYVESAGRGTVYDAMWNYEAVLKETNDQLRRSGGELLHAIYPSDGVAIANSPLGFVDRGRGDEVSTFFDDLQAHLLTPEIQAEIAATGRRLPLGAAVAAAEPDWNFDPSRLVTAIRDPEPAVIRRALDLYQETLRRPSLTALCLDYSGSMEGEGERQLEAATRFLFSPDRAGELLIQWSPADRIIIIPFAGGVISTIESTGAVEGQQELAGKIEAFDPGGGTDMYACGRAALDAMKPYLDAGRYLPAILMLTDGRSEGDRNAFLNDWRAAGSGVPVFGITFGDADRGQLDDLAEATSARVFDGTRDLADAFRSARGYN